MANFYKNFASETLMSFGKSFARLNGQPLDKSAIWYSKDEADAYAATGSAYVGQPVAVIDEQAKTTTLYVVGANSTLEMVGALPDGLSIELHEGKIQIHGFDEAAEGAQLRKNADGELEWFVPSTDTVDGLQSAVGGLQSDMKTAQDDITALEGLVGEKAVATQIEEAVEALDLPNTYEAKGAAATAKGEIEAVIGEVPEGKTVAKMIEDAQAAATYDDTELAGRVKAIEDDHLDAADKTELEGKITAEQTRAEGIESGLRTDVDAIKADYLKASDKQDLQDQIDTNKNAIELLTNGVDPDKADGVKDLIDYVEEHGTEVTGMKADIAANTKAISDHEALAAETYETKTDAAQKLEDAKDYADGLHQTAMGEAAKKVDKVEGKSLVDDAEITKLAGVEEGAQKNKIETVDEAQFGLDDNRHLTLLDIAMDKVTGLEEALAGKAGVAATLAGYGITDAYTKAETEGRIQEVMEGLTDTSETAASVAQALETYKTANDARVLAVEGEVAKKVDAEEGKALIDETLITKLEGIAEGAEKNVIGAVSNEFTISADGRTLQINKIEQEKVDGLAEALAGKVDVQEGYGLISDELVEKLEGIAEGAQPNVLEGVQINGADVAIADKKVNIKSTDVVKGSTEVTVAEDGTLGVGEINVDKLVQTENSWIILNGGTAAG